MDDGTRDARSSRAATTAPYEEEFLFHLSRGSEFLVENHVERAKEELERALRYQPHDAKGQDLLASVYFRLGLYPRAIEIWTRLTRAHPNDLALCVNLGLVLLKTGQPEDARANFQRATEIDPKHARAFRYLGLAQWRCGQLDAARESFLHGGEVTMARRMEEMLGEGTEPPPPPSVAEDVESAERAEVRTAASDALERFATETAPLALETSSESASIGTWRVVEQGRESVPRTVRPEHPAARGSVETLSRRLDAWSVPSEGAPRLSVAANGVLMVMSADPVFFRSERIIAVRGTMQPEAVSRRGREGVDVALGGDATPIVRALALRAFVAPPLGARFIAVALTDDALFVVESHLEAFEGSLVHENVRAGDVEVVSLRGTGIAVLLVPAEPSALPVAEGELAHVDAGALVGWSGRLFPVESAEAPIAGMLAFRGEGTLLVI